MTRVLVVDDEEGYRVQLQLTLLSEGYEVCTASSGREAIDVGTRFRPDIVVVDWMLKQNVHGLHVVDALRAVTPGLQAILVTGFASDELRADAQKKQIVCFIEKPFERDEIRSAVRLAIDAEPVKYNEVMPGIIEIDGRGNIRFMNYHAKELLAETYAGPEAESVEQLFQEGKGIDWASAADRWQDVVPSAPWPVEWRVKSQEPIADGSRLLIVRGPSDPVYVDLPLIELLLGVEDPEHTRWTFKGRVLVIDDEAINRRFSAAMLEGVGAGYYAVGTVADGLRLLEKDQGLEYVLLKYDVKGVSAPESVKRIMTAREGVIVVGTGGDEHWRDFHDLGINCVLPRRWRAADLIGVLENTDGCFAKTRIIDA